MPASRTQANSSWVAGGRSGSDSASSALSCALFARPVVPSAKTSTHRGVPGIPEGSQPVAGGQRSATSGQRPPERRRKVGKFRVGKRMPEKRHTGQTPYSLFLPEIFYLHLQPMLPPRFIIRTPVPLRIEKAGKDADTNSRKPPPHAALPRRTPCPVERPAPSNDLPRRTTCPVERPAPSNDLPRRTPSATRITCTPFINVAVQAMS
ncbi:hypothetical protein Enr13x_71800 [Stieleria neptunia]|uniref:Uncharacterized protein n=1 Tax=Stieleria neptunia TaxID=2527979 RepID=A0A518I2F9_9BACT|nr:hypothetical protein Enr13x_71800 [Stieleria neptunia]